MKRLAQGQEAAIVIPMIVIIVPIEVELALAVIEVEVRVVAITVIIDEKRTEIMQNTVYNTAF